MLLHVVPLVLALGGQAAPPQQPPPPVPAAKPAQKPPPKPYNEQADAKAQIATAIEAANVDDIRVLINWGANDHERSMAFGQALKSSEVVATRYGSVEYKVVNVNVGQLDKNLDLAATYGMKLSAGDLPALTVLDQKGNVLARASAPDFAAESVPAAFDPKKIAAFFTQHQAPAPDAIAPFEAALKQAKQDGKYVFVWFSAPW